ncbi:MAG: PD-(D/E)XK nuclease family protein [Actinobacteria bacterium]|nr:PD-(D/E)XK nuclease family protein [Actinomycetota bacterium]
MAHLSPSAVNRFVLCPEDYRRYYLIGERPPASPAMICGKAVDECLGQIYRSRIDGQQPELSDALELYDAGWQAVLDGERNGVQFTDEDPEDITRAIGRQGVEKFWAEIDPQLGTPLSVQREIALSISPAARWIVKGYLDLETVGGTDTVTPVDEATGEKGDPYQEQLHECVVDLKVKGKLVHQGQADTDLQASTYLLARAIEGRAADAFRFAQVGKPGKNRKQMTTALVTTRRTRRQLRTTLVRYAQAAASIRAMYDTFGAERPWQFADPTAWKCSGRYCSYWSRCPAGGGAL